MEVTFDGVKVKLGDQDYVIPPLNLKQIRKYQNQLKEMGNLQGIPEGGQIELLSNIILDAIQRNYPDFTMEKLEEVVDIKNIKTIFQAIMGVSGLEATSEKE